jgi:pimeloyl-ACP methyl ester carboxylesterase
MSATVPVIERVAEELPLRAVDGLQLLAERRRPDIGSRRATGPVLFAHGFGQTRKAWSRSADTLASHGIGSLAFDARGHGESDRNPPGIPYRGESFVDDIALAAAATGPDPVLVGASMGGLFGMAAQARSRCFAALVLVDITPRWESAGTERIFAFMRAHPDGFADFEHAATEIAHYLPHRRERKAPGALRHLLVAGPDGRLRWHWDPRLLDDLAGSEQHQEALTEAARDIRVPVLLISGGRSDLVSGETIAHFLELVPHAEHVCLPDATHMVAGDENDAFTAAVLQFLTHRTLTTNKLSAGASP